MYHLMKVARELAAKAHAGQKRRGGLPYEIHAMNVGWKSFHNRDYTDAIVGFLHDTLEDTKLTVLDMREAGIPEECITAVVALTKREGEGYNA